MAASTQDLNALCPKKYRYVFLSVYRHSLNTSGIIFYLVSQRDFHKKIFHAHSQEGGKATGPTLNSCLQLFRPSLYNGLNSMVKDKYHIPKISSNQKGSGQLWVQKAQELWISKWSQDPVSREIWLTFQSKSLNLRKRRKEGINFPYVSPFPEESRTILKPAELCL